MNRLLHDDDLYVAFDATQQARHEAVLRINEMAKALVDRARADAATQKPDDDTGEVAGPGQLRLVLGFASEDMSTRQRAFLHAAVFPQIAEQVKPEGVEFSAKTWKEFYRALYLGHRWECVRYPGQKRATPRKVRISTEGLSTKQYSTYIDQVIAHAVTEYGVEFHFFAEERAAVCYVAPPRKQRKPQTA